MSEIKKKILLVDDEKQIIESLQIVLEKFSSDYHPYTAGNGLEAIELLKSIDIDLVITDLHMPVMDGFELLAYMSRHFSSVPTIVLSGHITPEAKEILSVSDPVQLIDKPLKLNKLFSAIEEGLRRGTQEDFVKGLTLRNFLQLVAIEQKSCVLETLSPGYNQKGYLYFDQGLLTGGYSDVLLGDDAIVEMLSWDDVEIRIKDVMPMAEQYKTRNDLTTFIAEARKLRKEERKEENQGIEDVEDSARKTKSFTDNTTYDSEKHGKEPASVASGEIHGNQTEVLQRDYKMDIQKLDQAVEKLKADLGAGLMAVDIWCISDGQSIAAYNQQPQACTFFNQLTDDLVQALAENNYPGLGKYYILDLDDGSVVVILPFNQHRAAILVDGRMVQLGLLLNIIIPQLINDLEEAVIS